MSRKFEVFQEIERLSNEIFTLDKNSETFSEDFSRIDKKLFELDSELEIGEYDSIEIKQITLYELLDEYLLCEDESRLSELRDMIDRLDYSIDLDEGYKYLSND